MIRTRYLLNRACRACPVPRLGTRTSGWKDPQYPRHSVVGASCDPASKLTTWVPLLYLFFCKAFLSHSAHTKYTMNCTDICLHFSFFTVFSSHVRIYCSSGIFEVSAYRRVLVCVFFLV